MRAMVILGMLTAIGCTKTEPAMQTPTSSTTEPLPASIGVARMLPDGTLECTMNIGMTRVTLAPSDPDYRSYVDHLGGMKPGDSKPIPPFPAKGK